MLLNRGSVKSKCIHRSLIIHSKPKKENQDWDFCYLVHLYIITGKRTFISFVLLISLVRAVHWTVSLGVYVVCVLNSKWPRFPSPIRVFCLFVKDGCFSVLQILFLCFIIHLSPFQNSRYSFPSILFSLVLSSLKRLSVFPIRKISLPLYI